MPIKSAIFILILVANIWIEPFAHAFEHHMIENECRIEGYEFPAQCAVQMLNKIGSVSQTYKILWYRIPSRARYPLKDPIVYIQSSSATSPNDRAIHYSRSIKRLLAKRDFIWIHIDLGLQQTSACVPIKNITIDNYLSPINRRINLTQCHAYIRNTFSNIDLDELYAESLSYALNQFKFKEINVISENTGINKIFRIESIAPNKIKRLVIQNPVYYGNQSEDNLFDVEKNLLALVNNCKHVQSCNYHRRLLNEMAQLESKLPATFSVNNPITNRNEKIILTNPTLHQLVEKIAQSDLSLSYLPLAMYHANVYSDIQMLIGLASISWPSEESESKINWPIWIMEKCMFDNTNSLTQNGLKFFKEYSEYKVANYNKMCGELPKKITLASRKVANALILKNNHIDLNKSDYLNPRILSVPQFQGGLITHGCIPDIIYKFMNNDFNQKDFECINQIPSMTNEWLVYDKNQSHK